MIEISHLTSSLLNKIIDLTDRSSLDYFEYKFLHESELKSFFQHGLENTIHQDISETFVAVRKQTPLGFVTISKNEYDSHFFGFPCFQLRTYVFSDSFEEVNKILNTLLCSVEAYCSQNNKDFYIYLSLNNNSFNCTQILNSLLGLGYYLVNTLLTFSVGEQRNFEIENEFNGVQIREVTKEDVEAVSSLAARSFQFSRFHMDPFLENEKANLLIKTSAENSILHGFVDVMFVAEKEGQIAGYYSAKSKYIKEYNKTVGISVISAVDSKFRGMGIFNQLDNHILRWYIDNCDFSEVGTYLGNIPVHRTWVNKKLKIVRGTYQLSKMYSS